MCIDQFLELNPITIAPDTILQSAIALMSQPKNSSSSASAYLLVMAERKLVGILTAKDVVRLVSQGVELATTTAGEVMTTPVITRKTQQCQNIWSILSVFQQHSLGYLPIVDENQELVGVISSSNLIRFLPSELAEKQTADSPGIIQQDDWQNKAEELERIFDFTPSMVCIAGLDGYFKRINPAFGANLGFTDEELVTKPFINFVHPEDRAKTIAEVEKLAAGKTTISFENRYRTKDDNYRWLLWTAKPYLKEQTIFCVAQDITEQKQAEVILKERNKQFRILAQRAPVGIFQTDAQGNCVFVNLRWQQITGLSNSEARGEGWSKALHPDDRDRVFSQWYHCAQTGQEFALECRFKKTDNRVVWVFSSAVAHYDADHEVSGYLGTVTDITELKMALQNRQRAEILLKQKNEFSDAIVNTVGALIVVLDRQGKIVSFNRTCEQTTGYSFEEVQGRLFWEFLIVPEEKEAVESVFKQIITGHFPNQYENYWVAKDDSRHLISWSNTALFDAQGVVEFIIATGIDVTEQRQVWNNLEQQYRRTQLLAEITRKIRASINLEDILQAAVTEVQNLLACDRVLIMEVGSDNIAIPISESVLTDLPSMMGYELADPLLRGDYLTTYRQGGVLTIEDLAKSSISSNIKRLLMQFQIQAKLVVPILSSQSKLHGLLVAHQCHSPRHWQENEIQLLKQLADQIGVALSQANLLNNLEESVRQRTSELTTTNELLKAEIAERRHTETALRENQQKLTGILDNADEAIISVDEKQKIQIFNQGAEHIFGYQSHEIIGQPLDLLLPEVFRPVHRRHIQQFGKSIEQSRQMGERSSKVFGRRKNGAEFPAEASIAKLDTKEGILFTVMLKDVTERQQNQEKLEDSKALLARAGKIAKIGSWEYNHETQKRSWSEELFSILEFESKEPMPSCQEILARVHPEDRLLVKKTLYKGHIEGEPWQLNYRLLFPSGMIKYLESRGEPTTDFQGKVLKVLETIIDVSDRIQAEKSRQRSEEQLKLITDALPVLIAYIDTQQSYRYNNRTYETWYGKPSSSLVGRPVKELVGEENYQMMLPYIEAALTGETVAFEIQPTAENGSLYWMSATYIPDFDSDGQVQGFFSMVDDITNRKVIEKIKSEFVSIASHEMRTPLTSIHGVIKLLCAGRLGSLSEPGKKMADMALRNSDRLINLVEDILDLERMESGRDELEKQSCDSVELIQQAIDTLSCMAKEQQVDIQANSQSVNFWGDRGRIIQTLINLLSNAIKFSHTGGKVWVTCDLQSSDPSQDLSQNSGQNIIFAVRDKGRGIPQNKLETIFERFQQVDASDSRKKGGTGLGLAICRHIVGQHGGKIWVESVVGEGSTFFFSLPMLQLLIP